MTHEHETENGLTLDSLFEAARRAPPPVSATLMARILADAEAAQPVPRGARWRQWLRTLGGAPGAAGLITASCLGFWVGVAPPAALPDLAGQMLGVQTELTDPSLAYLDALDWEQGEG